MTPKLYYRTGQPLPPSRRFRTAKLSPTAAGSRIMLPLPWSTPGKWMLHTCPSTEFIALKSHTNGIYITNRIRAEGSLRSVVFSFLFSAVPKARLERGWNGFWEKQPKVSVTTCPVPTPVNMPDLISFLQEFGEEGPIIIPIWQMRTLTTVNGGTHSMNLVVLLEVKGALCPLLERTKGKQEREEARTEDDNPRE